MLGNLIRVFEALQLFRTVQVQKYVLPYSLRVKMQIRPKRLVPIWLVWKTWLSK